jgi:hypothetical protein
MQLTFCPDNFWGHMKMAPELRVDLERMKLSGKWKFTAER